MRVPSKFRLLFFGSDIFSIRVINRLLESRICPISVVTKAHSQLDEFSASKKLTRFTWPLVSDQNDDHNIGLVASFGHMIDIATINRFSNGLFNVHPSLLPKYRGSTPIQTAILNGDEETGCSIMRIPPVEKFDIGDIILQERVAIGKSEYAVQLRDRLADHGANLTLKLLLNFDDCISSMRPQSDVDKSYARKLKPQQGLLSFRTEHSRTIDRKVRAFTGFLELYSYCLGGLKIRLESMRNPEEVKKYELDRLSLRLIEAKAPLHRANIGEDVPPGFMFFHKPRQLLCIKCADKEWLAFERATPEHKPNMTAKEFYSGYLSKVEVENAATDC